MRSPRIRPEFQSWLMSDGYPVQGRLWRSHKEQVSLAFIYLHGIQSHGGWFEWSAALLAESGNPVLLADRRGSGLNHHARGDTPSAERWLEDIDELATWAEREFGVRRFGVVGVSWGGKLAAAWARRRPELVERLLLIAPGLFPAVDLSLLEKLRVGFSLLKRGRKMFEIPLNDPALFTENPAGQEFIANDPLRLIHVSARFLWHSQCLDRRLRRLSAGALGPPIQMILAGRERIICNALTEAWARRVATQPLDITNVTNATHTLEFEQDESVFADLLLRWSTGGDNRR